ncbi:PadR family transcriptional regulator [Terriglobus aquaticus]|uniref:PadR family transcriptional regulator n=1 Tax=Terriglobus aquaticus TaxID=940139 RepID=A0ABW9KJV0_9BACT|nr:PadR family transcriptional regulator [Terriglobus aquaticus]
MVGEFEYLVLTAVARLGDEAYGAAIRRLLAASGRQASIGALYTTLDRMEAKGLVQTWMGEATAERGGRAKRMVRLTPNGVREAKEFFRTVTRVSRGVAWAE